MSDLEAYLARVRHFFGDKSAAHRALFAALLAERQGAALRADDPAMGEVLDRLWAAADGGAPTAEVVTRCDAQLRDAAATVDPDRSDAPSTRRRIDVVGQALRCSADLELDHAVALTVAFVGTAADVSRADPHAFDAIRSRWSWERVRDEIRWLDAVLDALGAAPPIDGVVVRTMRGALIAAASATPAPATPKPTSTPEPGARPAPPVVAAVAAAKVVTRPAVKSVASAQAAAPPELPNPNRVSLRVGERSVTFVEVQRDRYRVEVDGAPRALRTRMRHAYVHEGNAASAREAPPPWMQSDVANIAPLVECLANAPTRTDGADASVTLRADFQWGHYRQNRWIEARVALADDGAVVVDCDVATQDDSYY